MDTPHLFCFGLGYTASVLAKHLLEKGWRISGTCRSAEKCDVLATLGITAYLFDDDLPLLHPNDALRGVTHILHSIPPGETGDPVLREHLEHMKPLPELNWFGYLSTTGVYGDSHGAWVDETTELHPTNSRSIRRKDAEQAWLATGLPVHIFRLSGIYGPGRSAIDDLHTGTARRIDKPGQVFSRIHVEDIAAVLDISMHRPHAGETYNCADDLPAPQAEVVEYAATLLGLEPPPLIPFETADLSPMARSFYENCRRVSNAKIKEVLGITLRYPTYKEGLRGIFES